MYESNMAPLGSLDSCIYVYLNLEPLLSHLCFPHPAFILLFCRTPSEIVCGLRPGRNTYIQDLQ